MILYSIFSYLVCSVRKFQIIATSSILIPLNNINCTLKSFFVWASVHDFLVLQKTAWLFSPSINLSLRRLFRLFRCWPISAWFFIFGVVYKKKRVYANNFIFGQKLYINKGNNFWMFGVKPTLWRHFMMDDVIFPYCPL